MTTLRANWSYPTAVRFGAAEDPRDRELRHAAAGVAGDRSKPLHLLNRGAILQKLADEHVLLRVAGATVGGQRLAGFVLAGENALRQRGECHLADSRASA